MNVKEFYSITGGNYEEVLARLGKEERIVKYLKRFADDTNYFEEFLSAFNSADYETAFRTVHNIKGLALNLGIPSLFKAVDPLCEAIRHGKPEFDVSELITGLKDIYENTVSCAKQID